MGWSKCSGCVFYDYCWPEAEAAKDVAIVPRVDQGLARQLHAEGVVTVEDLLNRFDEPKLSDYRRPRGKSLARVGKLAERILRSAAALQTGREVPIRAPELPDTPNIVMFDVEGLPPGFLAFDGVYLWGLQVFGDDPGPFMHATADIGPDGDEKGWRDFLSIATQVFKQNGDIPFVHWANYEKQKVGQYIGRYGDETGVANRVLENLVDLLPITEAAVALPRPSYSLKVVEEYVGFERELDAFDGQQAMASYIQAVESGDPQQRAHLIDEIVGYNEEDLAATWAVYRWLGARQ